MCFFCFPAKAFVLTPAGQKAMKDLVAGDTVRVVTADGKIAWSETIGWLHREPERVGEYLRITTPTRQVHISGEHLVGVVSNGQMAFQQARELQAGSTLLECDASAAPSGSTPVWGNKVQLIERVQMQGVYAPLTMEGTIVVDGVGASCYAATHSHKAAHAAMKPMRHMYRHNPDKVKAQTHVGKHVPGSHKYVDVLARVAGKA